MQCLDGDFEENKNFLKRKAVHAIMGMVLI